MAGEFDEPEITEYTPIQRHDGEAMPNVTVRRRRHMDIVEACAHNELRKAQGRITEKEMRAQAYRPPFRGNGFLRACLKDDDGVGTSI